MPATSAGILAFRRVGDCLDVLLVHPGGPYWRNKDDGAWSIPKGEVGVDEEPEEAARREFEEELGLKLTEPIRLLGRIRQKAGKWVDAYGYKRMSRSTMFAATLLSWNGRLEAVACNRLWK